MIFKGIYKGIQENVEGHWAAIVELPRGGTMLISIEDKQGDIRQLIRDELTMQARIHSRRTIQVPQMQAGEEISVDVDVSGFEVDDVWLEEEKKE